MNEHACENALQWVKRTTNQKVERKVLTGKERELEPLYLFLEMFPDSAIGMITEATNNNLNLSQDGRRYYRSRKDGTATWEKVQVSGKMKRLNHSRNTKY